MTKLTKEELQKIADLELPKGKAVIIIAKLLDHIDALEEEIKNHRNNIKNLETVNKTPDICISDLVEHINNLTRAVIKDMKRRQTLAFDERKLRVHSRRLHPRIEKRISDTIEHFAHCLNLLGVEDE